MNVHEIRNELKNGKSIGEVCKTYGLSFGELVECLKKDSYEKSQNGHIFHYNSRYTIHKEINGKVKVLGSFETLKEAEEVVKRLKKHNWDLPFSETAGLLYVYQIHSPYWEVKRNKCYLGYYKTREDAITVRNAMEKFNWDKDYLPLVLEQTGVERIVD